MRAFDEFVAIDWSGARGASHPGIAVARCGIGDAAPTLVAPPGRAWSRAGIRDWLTARADKPVLVGMDFSFSAPFAARGSYFPGEDAPTQARALWAYVDALCRDDDFGAGSFLDARRGRHFYFGLADGRKADFLHFRACEGRYNALGGGKASTVYDAIGAGQVAKASFAGMRLLHHLPDTIGVWPFDPVPAEGAVIVEIYTTIAARAAGVPKGRAKLHGPDALDHALAHLGVAAHHRLDRYSDHATDAILTSAWLRANAGRAELWAPSGLSDEIARTEGWTFGVV